MADRLAAAIALTRFGLGARPGEIDRVARDPRGWLTAQVSRPAAFAMPAEGLSSSREAALALESYREARQAQRRMAEAAGPEAAAMAEKVVRDFLPRGVAEVSARLSHGLTSDHGFAERLVQFWANHFTVAATKLQTIPFAPLVEREAIRPHLTGSFGAMHRAVMRHPGMLTYLDQAQSAGPNSLAGRRREAGLNENLAREALELHTLGAQGGYTQADVTEFAKALTGWTIAGPRTRRFAPEAQPGDFVFLAVMHEPGPRTVLGKRYAQNGAAQADAILADLARHPATARRVATRLATHFIADAPPPSAVARLERAFLESGGDLPTVHRALAGLPEAWDPTPAKYKTPNDFLVSALRMANLREVEPRALRSAYDLLGQAPFRAPSPEGWPDDAASWAGPDAVMKRLEWSQAFAERLGERARPEEMAEAALGPRLTARTRTAIARAESASQGLTLALMSPEFQRR